MTNSEEKVKDKIRSIKVPVKTHEKILAFKKILGLRTISGLITKIVSDRIFNISLFSL